jgi:hypothetical protein
MRAVAEQAVTTPTALFRFGCSRTGHQTDIRTAVSRGGIARVVAHRVAR